MPDGKRKSFITQMHDQVAAVNEAVGASGACQSLGSFASASS